MSFDEQPTTDELLHCELCGDEYHYEDFDFCAHCNRRYCDECGDWCCERRDPDNGDYLCMECQGVRSPQ